MLVTTKGTNAIRLMVISVVALVSLLIGLVVYYNSLVSNLQETTCKTIEEVLIQEQNNFTRALNADKEALKGFSTLIATMEVGDQAILSHALKTLVKGTDFEYASFALPNGMAYNSNGETNSLADRDYFHAALAGETTISDPVRSKIRDAYIIAVATPVIKSGSIIGVLVGTFEAKKLSMLFMNSFDGNGYTYVATNSGELIVKTENINALASTGNLFDMFGSADFIAHDDYEVMRKNLVDGSGGHSQYEYKEQRRLMHYAKLPINDWNIFVVANPKGVEVTANRILYDTILLTAGLLATFVVLLLYNIINQKRFTKQLTKAAYVDEVTGSRSFSKFVLDAVELLKNDNEISYTMVKVDTENFRLVNEMHSMEVGNQILRAQAESLLFALDQETDAFGRIHADEFILLVGYKDEEERIRKRKVFEERFKARCDELINFKLVLPEGRYKVAKGETDFRQIYENVNFAHRLAKKGDSKSIDFDDKVRERAIWERGIENRMENALAADEFKMHLQPKYRLSDEKMVGVEALVRWVTADGTMVYPNDFIPIFEQNGFITKIDMYMFEKACESIRSWIDSGITPIPISVNFSRLHIRNSNFVEELSEIAKRHSVPTHLLEIELTETAMLQNIDVLEGILNKLHEAGFTLSMDDFGSGYSSLGLLKSIPVDVIKLDKTFFDQAKDIKRARTVITSIINMAIRLDIHIVAEGVETIEHINLLKELGCETVQGYYYARPMPADQLEIKLVRGTFKK